jgi:hypothetical protein
MAATACALRGAMRLGGTPHVSIVIHNYRWRLDLADGERKYDDFERRSLNPPTSWSRDHDGR